MTDPNTVDLKSLRNLLERFGADRERWPDRQRAGAEDLLGKSAEARALVAEFTALDRLLDSHAAAMEEALATEQDALAARIMSAVTESGKGNDNVVPLNAARQRRARLPTASTERWQSLAAAGALAASLVLGITAGLSEYADPALSTVSEALGLAGIESDTVAMSDPIFDAVDESTFDEDVL